MTSSMYIRMSENNGITQSNVESEETEYTEYVEIQRGVSCKSLIYRDECKELKTQNNKKVRDREIGNERK